jgi:hypothetical protein
MTEKKFKIEKKVKHLKLRIIGLSVTTVRWFHAPPGMLFSRAAIEKTIERLGAEQVASEPGTKFRYLRISHDQYNLIVERT